ncbi:MAG: hypothetical protein DRJ42_29075 [Deltaproteobacteria bacterium]|nr:MAG: hypothetical protein DRJ42_29075 [Deltaproteobacteria bacterium]
MCRMPPADGAHQGRLSAQPAEEGAAPERETERAERRPASDRRPRARGTLAINTRPWSKVYIGRRSIGTTPVEADVSAGRLRLELVDPEGRVFFRTVTVPAGGREQTSFDLR